MTRTCYKASIDTKPLPEPEPVDYRDLRWLKQAICVGEDPELWFPMPSDHKTSAKAKQICTRCPARQECLLHAIDTLDVQFGIRGGLTAEERARLFRRRGAA